MPFTRWFRLLFQKRPVRFPPEPTPVPYVPAYRYNDARNSMYMGV